MNYWLYTITSKKTEMFFELKNGKTSDATSSNFIEHIKKKEFPDFVSWSVDVLHSEIKKGDIFFINASGIGISAKANVIESHKDGDVKISFDKKVSRDLLENPIEYSEFKKYIEKEPRVLRSVVKLSKELDEIIPASSDKNKEYEKFAKKALLFLVEHVRNFKGGNKSITYSDLAKAINFPGEYIGNAFGKKIGTTLGMMGHLYHNLIAPDWDGNIPMIESLVVHTGDGLPADGLKEFYPSYPDLSINGKKDFLKSEYEKIFIFGERWEWILEQINIKKKESLF